ncbi:MAG: NrsF family protein [Alphaproteobacteria bacterium]
MQTDELIEILSQSPCSKVPLPLKVAVTLVLMVNMALTASMLGLRPDLSSVAADLTALHKTVLLLSILLVSVWLLQNVAKPISKDSRLKFLPWIAPVLLGASLGYEWMTHAPQEIMALFSLPNFPVCLKTVSFYGVTGSIFLTWIMRFYAPVDFRKTGMAIGFAAAAAGALGYSIHCPIDSPTFITISYGLPVLAISMVTRFLVPRFIKW